MRHGMRNTRELKLRRYTAHMIKLNEYLAVFHGEKASEKLAIWNLMKLFEQYAKRLEQARVRAGF